MNWPWPNLKKYRYTFLNRSRKTTRVGVPFDIPIELTQDTS